MNVPCVRPQSNRASHIGNRYPWHTSQTASSYKYRLSWPLEHKHGKSTIQKQSTVAWSRCHWWKWYLSVLHCYLDSSLGDLKLWIRPGRQAEGILGSTLMMAQIPTRPQSPSPGGQTSGLVGRYCWNEIVIMFLKPEHSAKKTSALDISFRMLSLWEIHFWNGVNVVTNGREWILFKFGR